MAVSAAEPAPPDFDARYLGRARSYRYRVYRRAERSPFEAQRSWWYPYPLDEEQLAVSAELIVGEHDFRAFTPTETQHKVFTRTVESAAWHRREDALEFEITADSFLRHMVRTLVGTMLESSRWRRCSTAARAARPGDGAALGSLPRECPVSTMSRAVSGRPLRSRRHADRLGGDHPFVVSPRGTIGAAGVFDEYILRRSAGSDLTEQMRRLDAARVDDLIDAYRERNAPLHARLQCSLESRRCSTSARAGARFGLVAGETARAASSLASTVCPEAFGIFDVIVAS